jgi:hypothetical protein
MKRTAPLKRTPFKSKQPERKPAKQIGEYKPRARECAPSLRVNDGHARMCIPMPKPEKAKPGKRKPTVAEAAWMDAITTFGCIACYIDGWPKTPGAVHHILRGGRRIGHRHTISLCDPGHHQNGAPDKISRHPWKARFEEKYGTEAELLRRTEFLVKAEGLWKDE